MPARNGYNNTITISEPLSLPSIPAEAHHEDTKEKWRPVICRMAAKYRWLEERVGRVLRSLFWKRREKMRCSPVPCPLS